MVNTAAGFADRGLAVDLVLARGTGPYLEGLPKTINTIDLAAPRLMRSLPRFICYLRKTRPTALMSALDHSNMIAIVAAKLAGVHTRVVVSVRNNVSAEARNSIHLKNRLTPNLVKWIYPHADRVIAVSRGVANNLIALGCPPEKILTIYNPVLTPGLRVQLRAPVNHPWFDTGAPPVILGIGRLHPQKNFPLLVRAFAQVRARRRVRLMILGEGDERARLERLIDELGLREDVALPGFVNNPACYIPRAAMFVLSSDWEGFGNVLVEALAAGVPIVSTNCDSGPAEILADGTFGQLTPVGDCDAMVRAILEALDEEPDRERLRERAEEFSLDKILYQYSQACFQ